MNDYQHPTLTARDVCPHCKKPVYEYRFFTPCLNPITTWHCHECGDVMPMKSVVFNETALAPLPQTR